MCIKEYDFITEKNMDSRLIVAQISALESQSYYRGIERDKMYKVLIVDDEPIIRQGLKTIIDWSNYGFIICGEAVNGKDGLDKITYLEPDLIIVDIKMPGIDGLKMIEKLKEQNYNGRIMILTGYSDFEYAKKAIELGIDAYTVKPIDEEELIKHLNKIKGILSNRITRETYLSQLTTEQELINELDLVINIYNKERIVQIFKEMQLRLGYYDLEKTKLFYANIYTKLVDRLIEDDPNYKRQFITNETTLDEIFGFNNPSQLYTYFVNKLTFISDQFIEVKPDGLIKKIKNYIDKNFQQNLKLETMARVFNYNSAYLGRLFKKYANQTFHAYLDLVRLEKAKQMLKDGLKVGEVAQKVGYNDMEYFNNKFQKYIGVSPSCYKKDTIDKRSE